MTPQQEAQVLQFLQRLTLGSPLDDKGLNHDDDSLYEIAMRTPNSYTRYKLFGMHLDAEHLLKALKGD